MAGGRNGYIVLFHIIIVSYKQLGHHNFMGALYSLNWHDLNTHALFALIDGGLKTL